ncbi:hypothetical protein Q5O24_00705 [Eubacteriaceae bacterium ES3]|nr:hypothetical protein Q5O24_00705 [Eubacteriaceae bacterium ES3]
MKIENSSLTLSGQHQYRESIVQHESLRTWNNTADIENANLDTLDISPNAKQLQTSTPLEKAEPTENEDIFKLSDKDLQKMQLLQKLLQALTGKKIKFLIPKGIKSNEHVVLKTQIKGLENQRNLLNQESGFRYERQSLYAEQETTAFNAQGVITTSDGKTINLNLSLNLSRSFRAAENVLIQAGNQPQQIDPLTINFNAPSVSLTQEKYSFDLDSDGTSEQISFVGPGSGFLALDLNNDGTINDGQELFGPQSGDGFSDLSAYDADGNHWIDENDPIYDKLQIWTKDENGTDRLFALGEKGVGAIYLGNVNTSFSLQTAANQSQGQIQKTGIFLKENGGAGTIQHIDLTV